VSGLKAKAPNLTECFPIERGRAIKLAGHQELVSPVPTLERTRLDIGSFFFLGPIPKSLECIVEHPELPNRFVLSRQTRLRPAPAAPARPPSGVCTGPRGRISKEISRPILDNDLFFYSKLLI
jgi:hypothetical protein